MHCTYLAQFHSVLGGNGRRQTLLFLLSNSIHVEIPPFYLLIVSPPQKTHQRQKSWLSASKRRRGCFFHPREDRREREREDARSGLYLHFIVLGLSLPLLLSILYSKHEEDHTVDSVHYTGLFRQKIPPKNWPQFAQ